MLLRGYLALWFAILGVGLAQEACAQNASLDAQSKALAHYIMGIHYDLNGQTSHAVREYEQSNQQNPKEPAVHLRLGTYYLRLGRHEDAVLHLKKVLERDPQQIQAHYLLALIYSSQKKFDLAAQAYENILKYASEKNPQNVDVNLYLAQLYSSQGKLAQAKAQVEKALAIDPRHVMALFLMGTIHLETGDQQKAIAYFHKVLSIEADHDGALNSVGYIYAEQGVHLDEALKMVRRAVKLDPYNGAYYDSLGWVLYKKGYYAEALMALQKAEGFISDPVIFEHMGDVYKAVGEYGLARKFWRKSLKMRPHQPALIEKIRMLEKTPAFRQEK